MGAFLHRFFLIGNDGAEGAQPHAGITADAFVFINADNAVLYAEGAGETAPHTDGIGTVTAADSVSNIAAGFQMDAGADLLVFQRFGR